MTETPVGKVLFESLLEAKRGQERIFSSYRILVGVDGVPEKVKAEARASWLRACQAVAAFPPAIRAAEYRERGNVIHMACRRGSRTWPV